MGCQRQRQVRSEFLQGVGLDGELPSMWRSGPTPGNRVCPHSGRGHNCDERTWVAFTGTDQINKYILSAGQASYKYEKGKNYNELCDAGLELELLV